jgi:hypothetical protein
MHILLSWFEIWENQKGREPMVLAAYFRRCLPVSMQENVPHSPSGQGNPSDQPTRRPSPGLEALDKCHSFFKLRELPLLCLEGWRVDAAAQSLHFYRVFQMQHLVIKQIFNRVAGA